MIHVEFINTTSTDGAVYARQDNTATQAVREVFSQNGRTMLLLPGKNRQEREKIGALLYKAACRGAEKVIILDAHLDLPQDCLDVVTGILLASWRFDKYRTTLRAEEVRYLEKVVVLADDPQALKTAFEPIKATIEGVLYARELTSEPANCLYPMAYAERLLELESLGLTVEVLDEQALAKIGMRALLAAGQGSSKKPCVVCLTWKGSDDTDKPIVLVGKGVCFDSGGLCIKPGANLLAMKWDKAGAGVVAGVMKSLALKRSSKHVVGIVGLIENMPDGKAIKPGDVIKTMSGQTVEIVDTDAEGRLVIADCLWYAQERFTPKALIDLGTLTQETFATLGRAYAGLYTSDDQLSKELTLAGSATENALWRLPMGEYFAKQLESSVADIKNLGEEHWGENGAAAEFLKRFIKDDKQKWAHIDIAGVSWIDEDEPLCTKGPTGFGVRLLNEWIG